MNQILYEDMGDRKPADIKKIVLFFCIAVLLFGIALGAIGAVQLMNSQTPVSTNKPTISVEKFDDKQIILSITHDKAISKILYNWNSGEDIVIDGSNRKFIERLIDMPAIGENVLNIYVIDSIGIEATYSGLYSSARSSGEPTITFSQIEDNGVKKIKIRAEDDAEITYLTYRWNEEEETRVTATDVSSTIIETNIDIPSDLPAGDNKLVVVAVDASNNQSEETKEIKIAKKPVIEIPRQNRSKLTIKVTDEVGLDYVQYILNGESYTWRSSEAGIKVCETSITLAPGENTITIKARNTDGYDANVFYGKCIYEENP